MCAQGASSSALAVAQREHLLAVAEVMEHHSAALHRHLQHVQEINKHWQGVLQTALAAQQRSLDERERALLSMQWAMFMMVMVCMVCMVLASPALRSLREVLASPALKVTCTQGPSGGPGK